MPALGAMTGLQALQQVKAGLKAIYLSGWQVAADANTAGQMDPDQSLYPVDPVPKVVARINAALRRADQIATLERLDGKADDRTYWMAPIVADAEAGFGGALNAFELMRALIEAGAAGVHFEDQLASEKKCGHLGGKVLVPISQHIRTLNAARLAADVEGVPTVLFCRTDAESAQLLTSDIDERDRALPDRRAHARGVLPHQAGGRQAVRHRAQPGLRALCRSAVVGDLGSRSRGCARFRRGHPPRIPRQMLAYNCSPSFNSGSARWELPRPRGSSANSPPWATSSSSSPWRGSIPSACRCSAWRGPTPNAACGAIPELQQAEFAEEANGFTAVRHQREVGVSYFDAVAMAASGGQASTTAMAHSTEAAQFHDPARIAAPVA